MNLQHCVKTLSLQNLISRIHPFDEIEKTQINETLCWIKSGAPLYRVQKPDIPPQHLVVYFVVFDQKAGKILLVDHKQAKRWLPTGGHVEVDEDPFEAVKRECFEELQLQADFWSPFPLFLTSTITVGLTAGHTDVSLWYVLKGDHLQNYPFDTQEFQRIQWFDLTQIPYEQSDPHLRRFIQKLQDIL